MRYLLSGGGTGGHIYPAIAIADKIMEEDPKADILFIGAVNGLEMDLISKKGYHIESITVSYLKRSFSFHNVKSAVMLLKGLVEANRILKRYQPDCVIGTGGYVSGPVLYLAAKNGYKTLIHEQNAYPGLTNRFLSRYVDYVTISFDNALKYFNRDANIILTGNPIRKEYYKISQEEARRQYPVFDLQKMVLISGGSGGSMSINAAVEGILATYQRIPFKIFWATGKNHYESVNQRIIAGNCDLEGHRVVPYIDDMPYVLTACDLVVCSAGAITIAEVEAANKYAVLIPKAYTAENHQEKNALMMEEKGRGLIIREHELTSEKLYSTIIQAIQMPKKNYDHNVQEPAVNLIWQLIS